MEEKNKKAVKAKPKTSVTSKKTTVKKATTKTTTKAVAKKPTAKKVAPKVQTKVTTKKVSSPATKKSTKVTVKTAPKKTTVKKEAKKEVKVFNPEKEFAYKKYIYYVGLMTLSFIFIIAIYDIATFYSYERQNYSYLLSSGTLDNNHNLKLETAKTSLSNVGGGYFIYISSTSDKDLYKFEKQLTKLIKKYNIEDKFYYINVDNILDEDHYENRINFNLGFNDAKISRIPSIVYVNKDKEVFSNNIIDDRNGTLNIGDFQKLLDINGFTTK